MRLAGPPRSRRPPPAARRRRRGSTPAAGTATRPCRQAVGDHQGLVHQRVHQVEHVVRRDPGVLPVPVAGSAQTASAASSVQPPAKTDARRSTARSSSGSRSQLQSTTPRSERCLAGPCGCRATAAGTARRAAPRGCRGSPSSGSAPRRAAISVTDSERSRAAASSMASGSPSSARHSRSDGSARRRGRSPAAPRLARSVNSRTAGTRSTAARSVAERGTPSVRRPGRAPRR